MTAAARIFALDYLRMTLLVVVMVKHAVAPYYHHVGVWPVISLIDGITRYAWLPFIDTAQWNGFASFGLLAEFVVIPLFFFISGLFVVRSIEQDGRRGFLHARLLRLGIPFLAIFLLTPLTVLPAYLHTNTVLTFSGFLAYWFSMPTLWIAQGWFLWVLLVFDVLAVVILRTASSFMALAHTTLLSLIGNRPLVFAGLGAIVSAIAMAPSVAFFGPAWIAAGPFVAPLSQLPLHFLYFLVGISLGMRSEATSLFMRDGTLAKHAHTFTLIAIALTVGIFASQVLFRSPFLEAVWTIAQTLLAVTYLLALCGLFARYVSHRIPLLSHFSEVSYGMFVVYGVTLMWMQYAVISLPLPAIVKAAAVIVVLLSVSYLISRALRKIPGVAGRIL